MRSQSVPKWIVAYSAFLLLLSFNTTILGYLFPDIIFSEIDLDNARPALYFYAARNAAIAVLFVLVFLLKDPKVFLVALAMRFVVELLDLFATLKFELVPSVAPAVIVITWLVVFLIPELFSVYTLYKGLAKVDS